MKTVQEMFDEYLLRTYPTTVLTHEELVRLKHGFFAGFNSYFRQDLMTYSVDRYDWELNEFFRDYVEEKK